MKKIIAIYPSTGLDRVGVSVGLPLSLLHAFSKVSNKDYDIKIMYLFTGHGRIVTHRNLIRNNNFTTD